MKYSSLVLTSIMDDTTTRTAFSVRDILNMPECKEREVETKGTKELDGSMKGPSTEHTDRPPSQGDKDLKESTIKGKNMRISPCIFHVVTTLPICSFQEYNRTYQMSIPCQCP